VQVQVADGLLIGAVEDGREAGERRPNADGSVGAGGMAGTGEWSGEGGFLIVDVSDPLAPRQLGHWRSGGRGTHRNYYAGGRHVLATANVPGLYANVLVVVDIGDPANPTEVGRFSLPEQDLSLGGPDRHYSLHGPAHVEGDRAYLPYGHGGMVILDIGDLSSPRLVSRLDFGSAWGSRLGVHTVLPLPERGLAVVNTESIAEQCEEPLNWCAIVDISDETAPRLISTMPVPVPPEGAPYANFSKRGGRFGPHNQHHHNHQPHLLQDDQHVYLTYFNAGLRLYDISDPYLPREVAWFLPDDPQTRRFAMPVTGLTTSQEDVLVDARGIVYTTDKNHGVHILRRTSDG
jgi:hypothetical protein